MTKSEAIETTARMLVKSRDPVSVLTAHGQLEDALNLPPDPQHAPTTQAGLAAAAEKLCKLSTVLSDTSLLEIAALIRSYIPTTPMELADAIREIKSLSAYYTARGNLAESEKLERCITSLRRCLPIGEARPAANDLVNYVLCADEEPAERERLARALRAALDAEPKTEATAPAEHAGHTAAQWHQSWEQVCTESDHGRRLLAKSLEQIKALESRLAKLLPVVENTAQALRDAWPMNTPEFSKKYRLPEDSWPVLFRQLADRLETAAKETP